uniref:Uncharacterized protein n=1 Tax=Caenorhabditis japonica TaxID=281687 RepID=A0A8R1IU76_CAEJA
MYVYEFVVAGGKEAFSRNGASLTHRRRRHHTITNSKSSAICQDWMDNPPPQKLGDLMLFMRCGGGD